jgi:kynurenine formamidase
LISAAREKKVVDLSVTLADDLPSSWPGRGTGNHRQPYMTIRFGMNPNIKVPFMLHMLDSHTGTHLVPPSYALPAPGFDNGRYAPEIQAILRDYESRFGKRGTSTVTAEQVPLSQTCGVVRVVDVSQLRGTTPRDQRPSSPEITLERLKEFERTEGPLQPGEVVVFRSGWSDEFYRPLPAGEKCLADPLNGKSEGWPALTAEVVLYLSERGVACVGTDGPTLGGVNERRALQMYWALGSRGMVGVEFLTNLAQLKSGQYFVFAPIKVRDCHGGPGRAIAFD